MADDFAQTIKGIAVSGDTIVSTDGLAPLAVKKGTTWVPLEVDSSTGTLPVAFTGDVEVVNGTTPFDVNVSNTSIAVTGTVGVTGDVEIVNGTTPLDVNVSNTSIAVTGTVAVSGVTGDVAIVNGTTPLDVVDDALDYTTDNVAIKGSTGNQLVVNSDGSINVATSGAGADNTYHRGTVNLVKATAATVVTRSPAATEYFKAFSVSGTGLCHWELQVGLTGSEVTIMDVWTTPSNTFEYVDIPDTLKVLSTETIRVRGTNSEKGASPGSDFTGYATLVRNT